MAVDREKVVQAALKFAEKKRYDKAIAEYQKLLQEDPNDPRILLKIGDLQHRGEMYQAAIASYERAAKHYASHGFATKAIAVYKQIRDLIARHAPQLEDHYAHVLPTLADLYQQLGLTSDALAAHDEVATKLLRAGRVQEAVEVFRKIVALDPANPLPHLRLAEVLAKCKDDSSIAEFSLAADMLIQLGRRDDALKVFDRLLLFRPEPPFAKRVASMLLDRGLRTDAMLALSKLQIAFQANPKDLETLELLARAFELIDPPKSLEVHKEMARLAKEANDHELFQRELAYLLAAIPHDEQVKALARQASTAPVSLPPDAIELDEEAEAIEEADELDVAEADPYAFDEPELEPASVRIETGDDELDADTFVSETLNDAQSFRLARQFPQAIETLRIALEVVPGSVPLREMVRDVLLEVGDREGAVGEMITLAAIAIEQGDELSASNTLNEVLLLVPGHQRASEMLASLSFGGLEPVLDEPEAAPALDEPYAIDELDPIAEPELLEHDYEADFDAVSIVPGDAHAATPLPSYDLEEVGADEVFGHEPEATSGGVVFIEPDDPFESAIAPPVAQQLELAEDEPFLEEVEDEFPSNAISNASGLNATPMLTSATRGFQGGDSIEDALGEVDFFASRGLYEDARAIIEEQLHRWPNHPLLLSRLEELHEEESGQPQEFELQPASSIPAPAILDEDLLDASLDALDAFEPTQEAQGHFQREEEQVDVEAVFAKFKEGVKAQVDDSDSATHYDLGVAYREMGLIADAIGEFRLAARDPHRACVCLSMVGMIEQERGELDAAAEAFKEALATDEHTTEQELSLYYELGAIYETKRNNSEALYFYKKVQRKDPQFRDIAEKIRALEPQSAQAKPARQLNMDEDFDSVFDEILGNDKLS